MPPKIKTKFVSNQTKETMTRLGLNHQIKEIEFKQQTDRVTESLLSAKCMYVMSVIFAIDIPSQEESSLDRLLRESTELVNFLELLMRNHMSSTCIFIPFKSINEYLEMFPLTIFLFVKHNMTETLQDHSKQSRPICYHVLYRSNGSNKLDTFKTIGESYARLDQLSTHSIRQFLCQFEEKENNEYNINVRNILK